MHGAVANADLNMNLFLCDSSVFPDQTINPRNHIRGNGSMGLSWARIALQWCASFAESLLPFVHTCQGHTGLAIHSRHAMKNFVCSSTLSHQEMNHTSLFFFACLHFQCWINTLYTTFTSRAIKKQLCGPVSFQYVCLLPCIWQYRYVTTVLPAFTRNVFYSGCSVFIWLPLILSQDLCIAIFNIYVI